MPARCTVVSEIFACAGHALGKNGNYDVKLSVSDLKTKNGEISKGETEIFLCLDDLGSDLRSRMEDSMLNSVFRTSLDITLELMLFETVSMRDKDFLASRHLAS